MFVLQPLVTMIRVHALVTQFKEVNYAQQSALHVNVLVPLRI